MYFVKSPYLLQLLNYPRDIWQMDKESPVLFLTFDDGPVPEVTPWVLDTLRKFNALATFFCVGDNVARHPGLFQNIHLAGHTLGNHTYNHLNGWKTPDEDYLANVMKCDSLLQSGLFRPPYGKATRSQKKILREKFDIVYWTVISGDFDKTITREECLDNVLKNSGNGDIILFHDSIKANEKLRFVLPAMLSHFSQKGYTFAPLPCAYSNDRVIPNPVYENANC